MKKITDKIIIRHTVDIDRCLAKEVRELNNKYVISNSFNNIL